MRYNVPKSCAALLCRACAGSPACVAERYLALRIVVSTGAHRAPGCRKKSSAVPLAAVTCRQSAPDYPRERVSAQEGGNRRCLPSCSLAAALSADVHFLLCPCRAGKISSLRKRHSAILHLNAKEEHCCLAVSLFAHITGFCFPDFFCCAARRRSLRSPRHSLLRFNERVSPGRCAMFAIVVVSMTDRAFSADD